MIRAALIRAMVPMTILTFSIICTLAPLYVTMSLVTRQITNKTN